MSGPGLIFGSVCSGIEAASVAWEPLGWRAAFVSDIEAAPRAILAHRWPDVPLHGDFTTIRAGQYDAIDLLVGGTPCQSFSVAGLRGGLDDERGNLALEFLRLARRLRPRWLVWENVPGVLSSGGGRDFGAILGGMVELGYGFAYRVLDAQFVRVDGFARAVPQRRRRVFVVGYLGDWRRPAAVLLERASLSGHSAPRREARAGLAASLTGSLGRRGGQPDGGDTKGHLITDTIPLLEPTKRAGKGQKTVRAGDGFGSLSDPMFTLQAGAQHGVAVAFGGNDTRGPIQVSTALNAHGGPCRRLDFESETFVAHSLRAEGFDASEDGTGRGTPLVPIAFDTTQITSALNRSMPQAGDPCHPLAAGAHAPAIAFDCKAGGSTGFSIGEIPGTLRGEGHGGGHSAVAQGWAVRRLTPRECERLQGFPDDYTLVPYRGKPMADGPRYRALGNSMAVNVMRWLGTRIAAVEALAPLVELLEAAE